MDYVKKYGELIKDKAGVKPERARSMIRLGLRAENARTKLLPNKEMPKAFRMLTHLAMESVMKALDHPEKSCWTNIFAPVEIMQCFGLQCVSMECLSSFMSGFKIEDYLIDYAQNEGIASTLCSYHKNFIGGVDSGVLPKAAMSVTTSMICDGNINTFRHMEQKHQVESYVLDIPNTYSPEAERYVVGQLQELIELLETKTGQKLDMNELKATIQRENESKEYYKAFLKEQKHRYYPNTMTLDLYMLFASHLNIGTQETLDFFKCLAEDVKTYPEFNGKGILWVHLMPYYQETLQQYMNYQEKYYIQACDLNLDYMEPLDAAHPLEALAKKMILNIYNGPYERKVEMIRHLVKEFQSDAVIHFCHWGCKQSSGGVMLLKEAMREENVPMLILDGDALDRRNSHDGQIKTRLQAFLELIDNIEEDKD